MTLLEQNPARLTAASMVHHSLNRLPGMLCGFDLAKAKRQLARHIDRAGLGHLVALGGFDFSYNEPLAPFAPHWQPHAYVIFQGVEPNEMKQVLGRFYPATSSIPRPIRTRTVNDLSETLSYTVKAVFWRRSSYTDDTGRANTRCLPLPRDAERELLSYLDQCTPMDRAFLKNARRHGTTLTRSG
jgi:hypothetical protein